MHCTIIIPYCTGRQADSIAAGRDEIGKTEESVQETPREQEKEDKRSSYLVSYSNYSMFHRPAHFGHMSRPPCLRLLSLLLLYSSRW